MNSAATTAVSSAPATASETSSGPLVSFDDTRVAFETMSSGRIRKARLLFGMFGFPLLVRVASALAVSLLRLRIPLVGWTVRKTVFEQFCGGTTIPECESAVEALGRGGVDSILDYSAEGEATEEGFEATMQETLATLEWGHSHPHVAFGVFKVTGVARFGLLERIAAGAELTAAEKAEWERARARVLRICERTHALGARVFIDAEETWIQDVIDQLADEMMARFNRQSVVVYNTYQMYRTASLGNLSAALERAKAGGYQLGAKLVRGAYMEKERRRAEELKLPDPIQPSKPATDAAYDLAVAFCLDHLDRMALCAGTHNEASCRKLADEMVRRGIARDDRRVYFSQLYGMSDNISFNLAKAGFRVAKYLPYGPVRSVMPYLIRRAQENSAIAGQGGRELRLIEAELKRRKQPRA